MGESAAAATKAVPLRSRTRTVIAWGSAGGPGIGGVGSQGPDVTITGGTVIAESHYAAGIGIKHYG